LKQLKIDILLLVKSKLNERDLPKDYLISFYLETGFIYYQSYNWVLGEESFQNALNCSTLNYELTGVYGKKTRYQQNDIAQLILHIKAENSKPYFYTDLSIEESLLPKVIYLIIANFA
jgi:hypothetical protein